MGKGVMIFLVILIIIIDMLAFYSYLNSGNNVEINNNTLELGESNTFGSNINTKSGNNREGEKKSIILFADAIDIALDRVPGRVIDINYQTENEKAALVVRIDAARGPKFDVLLDPITGEVIGVDEV